MKDLIKVVVNADLPDLCLKAWYYHLEGVELIVTESDIPSEWKLPDNELWIDKKYCTVLQSDTQPEPVPFCSRTDALFTHMLSKYELSLTTEDLNKIIDIVHKTSSSLTQEVKGNFVVDTNQDVLDHIMKEERIPFDLGKWDTGKFDVKTLNGHLVEDLKVNKSLDDMPLFGVNNGSIRQWNFDGKYYPSGEISDYNLVLIPKTKTVWVNVWHSTEFKSKDEAKIDYDFASYCGLRHVGTIQVNKPIK